MLSVFKTKVLPIVLVFILAITMMPFSPFLDKAYAEELDEDVLGRSKGQVYIWDWYFFPHGFLTSLADEDDGYLTTIGDAGEVLREQMVSRNTKPAFRYCLPADATNSDVSKTVEEIFNEAIKHTGNPKEGDSLYYGWQQWYANVRRIRDIRGQYLTVTYNIKYYTSADQEKELDKAVSNLKTKLNLDVKNDYQKVTDIYDYICKNISYDWAHVNNPSYTLQFTPYAALVKKTTVCQGYATLFYRLALECDVDTRVITGTSNGDGHAWNIVKLGGQYFYLDSTWDASNAEKQYFLKGSQNWSNHTPFSMYTTTSFKSKYPVSQVDYYSSSAATPKITIGNVSATGKIKLSWNAIVGASGYEIERSAGNSSNYVRYTTTTTTSYTDTRTVAGTTYYYRVRAIYPDGTTKSAWGYEYQTCDLEQPVITIGNVASTGKIELSWKPIDGATSYEIYRSVGNDSNYGKYNTITSTSYIDNETKAGTTYYYRVRAIYGSKTAANSAWGYEYQTCDLAAPVITISNVAETGKVKLSWKPIDGATSYEIYRSAGNDLNYVRYTSTTTTSYVNESTVAGITYYYKVMAIYGDKPVANSAWGYEYQTCDLARPTIAVSGTKYPGSIYVSWNKIDGADRYTIYRATSETGTYIQYSSTTGITYTNTSVTKGSRYYYKIIAVYDAKPAANSAYSNIDYATVR